MMLICMLGSVVCWSLLGLLLRLIIWLRWELVRFVGFMSWRCIWWLVNLLRMILLSCGSVEGFLECSCICLLVSLMMFLCYLVLLKNVVVCISG